MGYILSLINDIDKTHKNLGNLIAVLHIASKARKLVLVISPSGCGKIINSSDCGDDKSSGMVDVVEALEKMCIQSSLHGDLLAELHTGMRDLQKDLYSHDNWVRDRLKEVKKD